MSLLKKLFPFLFKEEPIANKLPLPKYPNSLHKDSQGFYIRDINGQKHYVDQEFITSLGLK
jgi:hypothetical protein